jgi:hypothetical protein
MTMAREVRELLEDIIRRQTRLERRLDALQIPEVYLPMATANVSSPPTDAQIDAEFGTPAAVGVGFRAFIFDFVDSEFWLVGSNGVNWWYEQMTLAV